MKREELSELGLRPEAVDKVMALYGRDVEKHKASARDWEKKHADDTAALKAQLKQADYSAAASAAAKRLHFTSESARKAFFAELQAAELPLENGVLTGFDDFAQQYRAQDPTAFAADKEPVFVKPTGNTGVIDPPSAALRAAFGL